MFIKYDYKSYATYMYEKDVKLNNLQYHKTQLNPIY